MDFDPADCLRRYRDLAASQPDLFENPSGPAYEILLRPEDIKLAQDAARCYRLDHGLPAADTRIGVVAEDPYIQVMRDAIRFPDQSLGIYNRLIIPSGVVMLPIHRGRIVLIYRFRHGPRKFTYEAPRGMVPDGWSFEDAAREELREEIGATAVSLVPLGDYHSNTGIAHETMKLFAAHIDGTGTPSRHEAIVRIDEMTVEELETIIRKGEITDAATLGVYLQAKLHGQV